MVVQFIVLLVSVLGILKFGYQKCIFFFLAVYRYFSFIGNFTQRFFFF